MNSEDESKSKKKKKRNSLLINVESTQHRLYVSRCLAKFAIDKYMTDFPFVALFLSCHENNGRLLCCSLQSSHPEPYFHLKSLNLHNLSLVSGPSTFLTIGNNQH